MTINDARVQFEPWPLTGQRDTDAWVLTRTAAVLADGYVPEWRHHMHRLFATADRIEVTDLVEADPTDRGPNEADAAAEDLEEFARRVRPVWPAFADHLNDWADYARQWAGDANDGDRHANWRDQAAYWTVQTGMRI